MILISIGLTVIAAVVAVVVQLQIPQQGLTAIATLSATRLLLAGLILFLMLLIVLIWCLGARRTAFSVTAHSRLAVFCFIVSVSFLTLSLASRHYFDNPAIDLLLVYCRQMIPFLLYGGFSLTLILIGIIYQRGEDNVCKTIGQLFIEGRLVWQLFLIFLACLILLGAFIPIRANYYPSHDYSIFAYFGQQILKGRIPYLDMWDHKPPLIFYFNALGLVFANGSLLGIWFLEVLILFIGGVVFFCTVKRYFSEWISLPVVIAGILHYVRLFDFGNYTEEISLFFQLIALSLYFSRRWHTKLVQRSLISGLLCGLAFTCKQNTIGCWCALILLDVIQSLVQNRASGVKIDWKIQRRRLMAFTGGFLIINLIWIIYFASQGALAEYWDQAFRYNWIYTDKSSSDRLACALTSLTFLPSISATLLLAFLAWPVLVGELAVYFVRQFKEIGSSFASLLEDFLYYQPLLAWAILSLPLELVFAGLSGMNYQHYFILCIPPSCVLLCWVLSRLSKQLCVRYSFGKALSCGVVVLIVVICSERLVPLYRANYEPRMPSAYTKTVDYLAENSAPDDLVLVWGSRSAINVMSGHSSPTAYFNQRPLYLFTGNNVAQWERFFADLQLDPPRFIIYTHETGLPFISISGAGECMTPPSSPERDAVYSFFCENYSFAETINEGMNDAWDVYRAN